LPLPDLGDEFDFEGLRCRVMSVSSGRKGGRDGWATGRLVTPPEPVVVVPPPEPAAQEAESRVRELAEPDRIEDADPKPPETAEAAVSEVVVLDELALIAPATEAVEADYAQCFAALLAAERDLEAAEAHYAECMSHLLRATP